MIQNDLELSDYINQFGFSWVLVGDPYTTGGFQMLGAKEGDTSVNKAFNINTYTLPELTGDIPHEALVMGETLTVDIPLLLGNPALWATISPTGSASGGRSKPVAVQETSLLIIPDKELGNGLSYDGTVWTPVTPPENMFLCWRGYFSMGNYSLGVGSAGKVVTPVTFTAMFDDSKPEGHKIYTRGNPVTAGVTTFRL